MAIPTSWRSLVLHGVCCLLLSVSPVVRCEQPGAQKHYIAINHYVAGDYTRVGSGQGPIVDLLVNVEQKRVYELLPKRYAHIKRSLPEVDLADIVRGSLRCMPVEHPKPTCTDVVVLDDSTQRLDDVLPSSGDPAALVRISIEYRMLPGQPRGLSISYVYSEFVPGSDGPPAKHLMFSYFEPAPAGMQGSPLAPAETGNTGPKDTEAMTFWFSGRPSRFESSLQRSLSDFSRTLERLYPELHAPLHDPTAEEWWRQMPRLDALKKQGALRCRGQECKRPYLYIDEDRIIYFPDVLPRQIYPHSVPLGLFRKD